MHAADNSEDTGPSCHHCNHAVRDDTWDCCYSCRVLAKHAGDKVFQNINSNVELIRAEVGGSTTTIDVRSVTVPESEVGQRIGRDAQYFQEDRYYALPARVLGTAWSASRTSEWRFDTSSVRCQLPFNSNVKATLKSLPVYSWKRGTPVVLSTPPCPLVVQPQIIVQRLTLQALLGLAGHEPSLAAPVKADPTGWLLTEQMQLIASGLKARLTTIDKRGNVAYAQFDTIHRGVPVAGGKQRNYYLTIQVILVTTDNGIFMVKTYLPRLEPRSLDTPLVDRWLRNFHPVT
jgi:hypothetical protein